LIYYKVRFINGEGLESIDLSEIDEEVQSKKDFPLYLIINTSIMGTFNSQHTMIHSLDCWDELFRKELHEVNNKYLVDQLNKD